jgi:hypothetical protein
MRIVQLIFLIGMVLQLHSCIKDSYNHLSEANKKYLFYNLGDTVLIINKNDTLYGYVSEKEFTMYAERSYFSKRKTYMEEGILSINILNDSTKNIALFVLSADDDNESQITYSFNSLNLKNDSCSYSEISFYGTLQHGVFVEYSQNESRFISLDIGNGVYELTGHIECNYKLKYQLHISRNEGLSELIFNETDTLVFKKL